MLLSERLEKEQRLLGNRIIELKQRNSVSQRNLAEKSGLSVRIIRRIEKGEANPELKTLLKLAMGLEIRLSGLFDYKGIFDRATAVQRAYAFNKDFDKALASEKKGIGKRILQLCNHRKIDQEELGVLSKIASSDISLYINGEENLVLLTLLKISIGLEVELIDLFNYSGKLPDNKSFKGKVQF